MKAFKYLSHFLCLFKTPCGLGSFNRNLNEVFESQEQELENRRSSMMTMEILLVELNAERTAKNEEIQRLKVYICAKTYLKCIRIVFEVSSNIVHLVLRLS